MLIQKPKKILTQYLGCHSRLPRAKLRFYRGLSGIFLILFFSLMSCSDAKNKQEEPVFKQVPEIQEVKPDKLAKIKLKRNAKNDYSWEISGDDVEEIVRVDKRLRKDLNAQ